MEIINSKVKRWILVIFVVGLSSALGYYLINRELNRIQKGLHDHKIVRETTATVMGKEYVKFDEVNRSYESNLGNRIEVKPGDEQWRVYYQIDNFAQYPEPVSSKLLAAETKRAAEGRLRFTFNSRGWYDQREVGDKLIISYRWLGNETIEIIGVSSPIW